MARSLNKVELIGNLTRDPELRYTPQGTAVCTLGLATNRSWVTDSGEKKEEADFHRLVAWNKLAELCSQLLSKGRKIYVEGRLSNRSWTGQDGVQKSLTEIVINDMIILDSKRERKEDVTTGEAPDLLEEQTSPASEIAPPESKKKQKKEEKDATDVNPDDIPF
ncbi:MAG: hypothetical protein A3G66_01210 [Candidatus Levybacteria bacterium RIFCSPLOWO2_12_FULL_39_17]|nr:MAG: hypothetical protein A3G66_01210 [Candidatus Levybacteria bacterium RIFCSPLOWO2_12_FULL_39_17]